MSSMPIYVKAAFSPTQPHASSLTVEDVASSERAAQSLDLSIVASPALSTTTAAVAESVATIWERTFRDLPAYEGKDDINHRLFLVTNEENHARTLMQLQRLPQTGTLLFSNSGMMSLNVVAAREQSQKMHLLLIDCSRRVHHFWNQFQKLIIKVTDHTQFEGELVKLLLINKEFYYGGDPRPHYTPAVHTLIQLRSWDAELKGGFCWCHDPENFHKIRRLFLENRFFFKLGDWSSPELMTSLLHGIETSGLSLDTVVQNNIAEYCEALGEADFHRYRIGMARLLQPTTCIVKTEVRSDPFAKLIQQAIVRGDKPIEALFPASPE